jgi:hypothetical protein
MYVFAEPVSDERADEIQSTGAQYAKEWARRVIGVGKDDAEAQESWQDLQGEVDEQVSEDGAAGKDAESAVPKEEVEVSAENEAAAEGESTVGSQRSSEEPDNEVEEAGPEAKEEVENEPEVEAETSVENEAEKDAENEVEIEASTEASTEAATENDPFAPPRFEKETTSSGPLIGWTVTLRNKVNGQYIKRPEQLEREDNWQIEYNVQEIAETNVWKLYNATKERRRQLVGLNDDEVDQGMLNYRKVIQRYASRGRTWRAQQDVIDEGRGVRVFKPLGPGSEGHTEKTGSETAGE